MKLRALGRVKVCAASSSIAAYASTSTTIPEHSPQISSVPISSRAHVSGSRLKKDARTTLFINRLPHPVPLGCAELIRRLVVNRHFVVEFDRLAVTERRDEFRAAEIGSLRRAGAKLLLFLG